MTHDLTTPEGFDSFYRSNTRTVLRWVIRLGGPLLDAEDVAQDVFQMAFRKAHTFRGGSATAWLYGITRRVVANARRRARFRVFVGLDKVAPPIEPGPAPDETLDRLRQRRTVQDALERLTAKHREALVLVDLEGRTAVEAASCIQVSVGTVYSRLHHARKQFASEIRAMQGDERLDWLGSSVGSGS